MIVKCRGGKGGPRHPDYLIRGFREAIEDCYLSEVSMLGYPFTWERSRGKDI